MTLNRRGFLRMGLGSGAVLAAGPTVPLFLANSARALASPERRNRERILVVIQLDGGNDGLNTVVPYRDDVYRRCRPYLALPANRLHRLNDHMGLHPSLANLMRLQDNRRLAIVQSVGYPNMNRSHFESMAIWHTARLNYGPDTAGWLARCLDQSSNTGGDAPALHISEALLPQALDRGKNCVPSFASLEQFRRRLGIPEKAGAPTQRAALDQILNRWHGTTDPLLQFVEQTNAVTYTSSARLERLQRNDPAPGYPESSKLARRLKLIAQLIKAELGTSIYYTELNGFDTHASQANADGTGPHANLLSEFANAMKAFQDDLDRSGHGTRVLALAFSEFGRRLQENASGGTDHGTAGPVFLIGQGVRPGLHGPNPDLENLDETGDPRPAIDFRRIYATLLEQWLDCRSEGILGQRFEHLRVLQA